MDSSFTEHVLERARARQRKLAESNLSSSQPVLSQSPQKSSSRKQVTSDPTLSKSISPVKKLQKQNSYTKVTSVPSSPLSEVNTLNIQRDSFNMEIKFSSADNVRVEVEIDTDSDNDGSGGFEMVDNFKGGERENVNLEERENINSEEQENEGPALREFAKSRLQRLGKLYAGDEDLSSPIHKTEGKFHVEDEDKLKKAEPSRDKGRKGLGRLADLANNINQWEDDITPCKKVTKTKTTPKKSWKLPAPQPPQVQVKSPGKSPKKAPAPKPPVVVGSPRKKSQETIGKVEENIRKIEGVENSRKNEEGDGKTGKNTRQETERKIGGNAVKNVKGKEKNDGNNRQNGELESVAQKMATKFEKSHNGRGNKLNLDQNVLKTLERTDEPVKTKKFVPLQVTVEEQKVTPRSPSKIASRAALFEGNCSSPKKDPALLSVSERKALFERNAGGPPVVLCPFGGALPTKKAAQKESKVVEVKEKVVKDSGSGSIADKIALLNKNRGGTIGQEQIENKVRKERQEDMEVLMNRFQLNKKVAQEDSESEEEHEVSETTAMITSKAEQIIKMRTPSPPPPPSEKRRSAEKRPKKGDSPQVQAVLGDVKRIKVRQPKDGELYPCLSDIEAATETEVETANSNNSLSDESFCNSDDGANTSFGREILQAVCKNQSPVKEVATYSSDSDLSDVLEDMDDYLNELDQDTDSQGPTPPKHVKLGSPKKALTEPSESFNYKNCSPKKHHSPNRFKSPCKIITSPTARRRDSGELPTHVVMDGNEVIPLTHTVSFYRKQQTHVNTPIRQIIRQPLVEEETSGETCDEDNSLVAEKIEHLMEEIQKQQMVISQASRALNLCNSTPEFTGSTEQVEAEKLLLLATHRRQAASIEMQRLKVESTLRPAGPNARNMPLEQGTVTICDIMLPLKKEYVRALAAAGGKGHHVVCLMKAGEQVICTQLVSTVASSSKNPDLELRIPGKVRLENIYSDSAVTFEVYCLRAQEEILPHEVKYHIGKKGSSKITPKKVKQDSRLARPPKESPAGPQAVRSPTFALNGYVVFSIQAVNKTSWTLNKMPPITPLEGSVSMKVKCELDVSVEMRGFLNMFEDVSGLGAWHRRWCLLKGNLISYWKYPEDERKKAPIDTIDLKSCITKHAGPVSRDICARLNTFLLERERPVHGNDRDTLTVVCHKDKTIIKHLLSADSKEERIEWCDNLNRSLSAFRMWGNKPGDL